MMWKMKIASYNVQSGGFASYKSDASKPENMQLLQRAIAFLGADLIGLSDTFRWKDIFSEEDLKVLFGYKYAFHIDMDDVRVDPRIGLAVLSNVPLSNARAFRLASRNCIETEIELGAKSVTLAISYLDDKSEDTRMQQAQVLVDALGNRSAIVLGDLNSIHKRDAERVQRGFDEFVERNPDFKKRPDFEGYFAPSLKDLKRGEVLELFGSVGFRDACSGDQEPTAYTANHPLGLPLIFPVDHILYRGEIESSEFEVFGGEIFDRASDHYPVVCKIS